MAGLTLSASERIKTLALIYSRLTVYTRELFVPDWTTGKEKEVLNRLSGVNELHHTFANWLVAYTTDETKAFPVQALSPQLLQIGEHY